MSCTILRDACINCGACEYLCRTAAIRPPAPDALHPPAFWIETHHCNDCGDCPSACPVDCILPDPDTFRCEGRGCPVAPRRASLPFSGWECSKFLELCGRCGHVLWRSSLSEAWLCPRCDLAEAGRRTLCPKVSSLESGKTGQQPPRRSVEGLYEIRASEPDARA